MPKQRPQTKHESNSTWGHDVSFADVKLNVSERDVYLQWLKSSDANCIDSLESLVSDSYRVSLKCDYNNNCYVASLTQQDTKHINFGLVIMSRGDTVDNAILLSAYKVFVLFEGQRLPTASENNDWG